MKIAIISDIHSNKEALDAVLKDIEKKEISEVYCTGDLVGYGPDPDYVVEQIKDLKIKTIMGNYDDAIGNEKESCGCAYNPGRETEVGDESINWTIKNTSKENKQFLKTLPKKMSFEIEGVRMLLVHGSPLNYLLEYIKPTTKAKRLEEVANSFEEDIVINGHTHLSMHKSVKGKTIYNAGSVGRTKEGVPKAVYLIINIEKGVVSHEFVKVDYDIKTTIEKINKSGLPAELGTVLALGRTFDMGPIKKETKSSMNFNL
ncbi:MAG: metallophosphoesterase family protein [Thermotogota bacterium]